MSLRLYGYWRSSAAYRARIALNYKGLEWESIPKHLARGEQHVPDYLARNPQGLVPTLADGEFMLAQSLAIIEYLDETRPVPALLPADPQSRATVRAMALAVACDIHPLNNLRVLCQDAHVSLSRLTIGLEAIVDVDAEPDAGPARGKLRKFPS